MDDAARRARDRVRKARQRARKRGDPVVPPVPPVPEGKMGQPTKYTAEVLGRILTALAIGNTKKDSALGAGVTYTTMRTWELAYPEFLSAVEQARAQARQRMVGVLVTAASRGSWQAALAFLERTDPELWARRDRIDMAIDLRREVKQMAAENGLDEKQVMAEVQSLLAGHTPEERPE